MHQSQSGQDCSVFAKTQPDVRKGFWRRIAGETRCCFRSVSDEAGATREQCDDYGECGTWMAEHLDRKQSAAYRPNESVHCVPGRVEPWNFIGEKLQEIENAGDCDDPRVPKDLERLILRRQRDPMEMNGHTGGENGQVKVHSGKGRQSQRDAKQI